MKKIIKFKKTASVVLLILLCCICLSACGNKVDENKIAIQSENDVQSLGEKMGKGSPDDAPSEQISFGDEQVFTLGEAVTSLDATSENPDNLGVQYIVNDAKLWNTPGEAGIEKSQRSEKGEIYSLTGEPTFGNVDDYGFLLADINLKNINYQNERDIHIGELELVYRNPSTEDVTLISYATFFAKSANNPDDSDYMHYALPIGEDMDTKVGWPVDLEQYDKENIYLSVGEQYIKLKLS